MVIYSRIKKKSAVEQ
jgi:hypothetical protein